LGAVRIPLEIAELRLAEPAGKKLPGHYQEANTVWLRKLGVDQALNNTHFY
jgi:hypothetical protein